MYCGIHNPPFVHMLVFSRQKKKKNRDSQKKSIGEFSRIKAHKSSASCVYVDCEICIENSQSIHDFIENVQLLKNIIA